MSHFHSVASTWLVHPWFWLAMKNCCHGSSWYWKASWHWCQVLWNGAQISIFCRWLLTLEECCENFRTQKPFLFNKKEEYNPDFIFLQVSSVGFETIGGEIKTRHEKESPINFVLSSSQDLDWSWTQHCKWDLPHYSIEWFKQTFSCLTLIRLGGGA